MPVGGVLVYAWDPEPFEDHERVAERTLSRELRFDS